MHDRELYNTHVTCELSLLGPSSFDDLAETENDIEQPRSLEIFAQDLRGEYDYEIQNDINFLAVGLFVDSQSTKRKLEPYLSDFYGRISGFDVKLTADGHCVVAHMENSNQNKSASLAISSQENYQFTLIPDYTLGYNSEEEKKWLKLSKSCLSMHKLLQKAATQLSKQSFDKETNVDLKILEDIIFEHYGLTVGETLTISGSGSHIGDGKKPISQNRVSFKPEVEYKGKFLGLSVHEATVTETKKFPKLCIVLLRSDGSVISQPCYTLNLAYREKA